ncbi:MATE family efflux transporter [uncultured Fenollaria sp.]|uniref:MATE family efflux transporter n=1 Tax=uncultured Fenollaria sp. TaxID=1686315 RepID=UPI0025F28496|nr:MATE family efflux transporter [uncultured Fenollaria sp.]
MALDLEERKQLILHGDMRKAIITLATPIVLNNLIQTLYNLVDSFWVSGIGETSFGATGFVWPIVFLFISIGIGLSIAGTGIISQLIGRSDYEKSKVYRENLYILTFILSIIVVVVGILSSGLIIKLMGAKGDLYTESKDYLEILYLGFPFVYLYFATNSIFQASGDTKTPTIISGISAVINMICDPIFIYEKVPYLGFKGFNMGIKGAAIATVISQVFMAVAIIIIASKKGLIDLNFLSYKYDNEASNKILSIALPSCIGQSGEALGFIILNVFVLSYGQDTLTAFVTVNRVTSIISMPPGGIGQSIVSIVGQNKGVKNYDRVGLAFRKACNMSNIVTISGAIIVWIFRDQVLGIFLKEASENVMFLSRQFLFFILITNFCMGLYSVYQGLFQGSGKTDMAMKMLLGRLWALRIPMIIIFKYVFMMGPIAIWLAMSLSNLFTALYGYILFKSGKWKGEII